jgi:hypothetical protein
MPSRITLDRGARHGDDAGVTRPVGATILLGAWVLLSNPTPDDANVPLAKWKRLGDYESALACEQDMLLVAAFRVAPERAYRCERSDALEQADQTTP